MNGSPVAPEAAARDDHLLAHWAATEAGALLLRVRNEHLRGTRLREAGDRAGQGILARILAELRPHDAVLSEEDADDKRRLHARRTWIIDPLDGTREFAEPPREDWAVHVALWQDGDLVAGAVAQPAVSQTFSTSAPPTVPARRTGPPRVAVSRTRPPTFVGELADELGFETLPMGSAGAKVISVVRGITDVYVHAGGQYEWDSAAPVAVARAAGLHTSRIDGGPLRYNQDDVRLPDLLVCRPELADQVLSFLHRLSPTESMPSSPAQHLTRG